MSIGKCASARDRLVSSRSIFAIAAATGSVLAGLGSSASAATWDNQPAVQPTLTATATTNYISSVALKDGDVVRTGAVSTAGPGTLQNFFVVGVGSTPSTLIKLSGNPGGSGLITPIIGGTSITTKAANWYDVDAWGVSLPAPNTTDAVATISSNSNTTAIALNKNVTIGSLNFSGGSNDLNLVTTTPNAGLFSVLNFKTSAGTPTVTASGGKSLIFSDMGTTPSQNNGKLVIAGTQGLTIDNQNAMASLGAGLTSPTVASAGAVRFGFGVDWSQLSGTITLAQNAFALNGGGAIAQGFSPLGIKNRIVLGTTGAARLELFANTSQVFMRGLDGNASSKVVNTAASGGGPALTLGSFSLAADSYDFQGDIGATDTANSPILRVVKIGAGTQILSGNNHLTNPAANATSGPGPFTLLAINGGTLSLGTTGTIGASTTPGQGAVAQQFNNVYVHNGEFKMSGTGGTAARTQSFAGTLVMSTINNATGTLTGDSTTSVQSSGLNTFTLIADPSFPTQLTFGNLKNRNFGTPLTVGNTNANGATALFRGTNLGTAAPGTAGVASIVFTSVPTIGANGYLVGNAPTPTLGNTNAPVLRGALADTSATGTGAGFATYGPTGVRLLTGAEINTVTDSAGYTATPNGDNVKLSNPGSIGITGKTTNTLEISSTGSGPITITNSGTGLNAKNGLLFSGSDPITLTGTGADVISGTANIDNEDLIIHSINTGGVTIASPVSNTGTNVAPARQGWITYNGPGNFTLTGAQTVGNGGGIAFNGTGTTNLQAPVTSAAFVIVNQGTLKLGTGVSLVTTKPRLQLAAGAKLDLNNVTDLAFDTLENTALAQGNSVNMAGGEVTNSDTLNPAVNFVLSGTNSAATGAPFTGTISGNLNLIIDKGAATQAFANALTYTGSTQIKSGIVNLGRYANLPTGTTLTLGAGTTSGTLSIGDANAAGGQVRQEVAGLFTSGTGTANAVVGGGTSPSQLTVNYASGVDTFNGNLGSTGNGNNLALRKIGGGTLVLGGTNTYTGGTTIEAGTVSVVSDAKLGGVGSVTGGTPVSPISVVTNNVVLNGGTLQITGTTTINAKRGFGVGPLDGATGGSGTVEVTTGITTYGGSILSAGNTGTNSFNKTGGGTLLLDTAGLIDISGPVTISQGKLTVNGSVSSNSNVTVATAGTIDGTGTVGGNLTLNGTISPGNSPGTLTVVGDIVMNSSATLNYELLGTDMTVGGLNNDLVTGADDLTLAGTLNVTETVAGSFLSAVMGDRWRLINFNSPTPAVVGAFGFGSMPALAPGLSFGVDAASYTGRVDLVVVPEPTTLGVLGLGAMAMLRRRRR